MKLINFFANKATVLFGVLILSSSVSFADYSITQVAKQLDKASRTFEEMRGYRQTHDPYIGKISTLDRSPVKSLTLQLSQGIEYAILGVCDKDCVDMNLELYDENEQRLDFDYKPGNTPLVKVAPRWTSVFHVKITIPRCKANLCTYGIGVFGRQ